MSQRYVLPFFMYKTVKYTICVILGYTSGFSCLKILFFANNAPADQHFDFLFRYRIIFPKSGLKVRSCPK